MTDGENLHNRQFECPYSMLIKLSTQLEKI